MGNRRSRPGYADKCPRELAMVGKYFMADHQSLGILALGALPATAISALIVSPSDLWDYLWVALIFFVGLLTANITAIVRRANMRSGTLNPVGLSWNGVEV